MPYYRHNNNYNSHNNNYVNKYDYMDSEKFDTTYVVTPLLCNNMSNFAKNYSNGLNKPFLSRLPQQQLFNSQQFNPPQQQLFNSQQFNPPPNPL